jgi:hypothetical protein
MAKSPDKNITIVRSHLKAFATGFCENNEITITKPSDVQPDDVQAYVSSLLTDQPFMYHWAAKLSGQSIIINFEFTSIAGTLT